MTHSATGIFCSVSFVDCEVIDATLQYIRRKVTCCVASCGVKFDVDVASCPHKSIDDGNTIVIFACVAMESVEIHVNNAVFEKFIAAHLPNFRNKWLQAISISPTAFYNPKPKSTDTVPEEAQLLKLYPLQHMAIKFFDGLADKSHVKVFSFESPVTGKRRFLVAHEHAFVTQYMATDVNKRHVYEVIQDNFPCRLYFDIEYKFEFNNHINGNHIVLSWIKLILWQLYAMYRLVLGFQHVVILDSSTPIKFSKHVSFIIPKASYRFVVGKQLIDRGFILTSVTGCDEILFKNNKEIKRFINTAFYDGCVLQMAIVPQHHAGEKRCSSRGSFPVTGSHVEKCVATNLSTDPQTSTSASEKGLAKDVMDIVSLDNQTWKFFLVSTGNSEVSDEQKQENCIVDLAVYTKNRLFRLFLSSKYGKNAILKPQLRKKSADDELEFPPDINLLLTPSSVGNTERKGDKVIPMQDGEFKRRYDRMKHMLRVTFVLPIGVHSVIGADDDLYLKGNVSGGTAGTVSNVPTTTDDPGTVPGYSLVNIQDGPTAVPQHAYLSIPDTTESFQCQSAASLRGTKRSTERSLRSYEGRTNGSFSSSSICVCCSDNSLSSIYKSTQEFQEYFPLGLDKSCVFSMQGETLTESNPHYLFSPFPAVDVFVSTQVSHGGVKGVLQSWSLNVSHTIAASSTAESSTGASTTLKKRKVTPVEAAVPGQACSSEPTKSPQCKTMSSNAHVGTTSFRLTYQINNNRWCGNIGRPHKSNHIMMEVDLNRGFLRQLCWDPSCRGYKSDPTYLPLEVLPPEEYLHGVGREIVTYHRSTTH